MRPLRGGLQKNAVGASAFVRFSSATFLRRAKTSVAVGTFHTIGQQCSGQENAEIYVEIKQTKT
jgi:hypothetical protein